MRLAIVILSVVAVGCTTPSYGNGHLQCAQAGSACPAGFYCAADAHCWRTGSGPAAGDLALADDLSLPSSPADLAGVTDLGPTPSRCATANALLCDGFESALAGWTPSTSYGAVARDTSRAYRGNASLHLSITGAPVNTNPRVAINETSTFPIGTTIYVRMWAYFPSPLPATPEQSIELFEAGPGGVGQSIDTGRVTLNDFASPAYYHASATLMPLDRWTCVQLDMSQAATTGAIHISVDGTALGDIGANSVATPAMAAFAVALDFYGNTVPIAQYDAWFDEVILDDKPTTCAE